MPEQFAHYKILDRIGAGGMGEVYRARDTRHGRTVAVKVVPAGIASDPDRRERFMRDARAAAALSHPNIATLYEIGEEQGQLFLVFEYVPGEPLGAAIAGRPLNTRLALHLAAQLADALADAHALGVVHREVKPDNVFVTPKGNAKLLDCGFSSWTWGGSARDRVTTDAATSSPVSAATIRYVSPEQAIGEAVDQRTDIFSLGLLLYEMLTGVHPFPAATPGDVVLRIAQAQAPAPSSVNPGLPKELDAIVGRALSKQIANRFESAATLAAELRAVDAILDVRAEEAEKAAPVSVAARSPRRGAATWMVALAILAALSVVAWYALGR